MDNIFNLFKSVAENNTNVAVETQSDNISYTELLDKSQSYANWLSTVQKQRFAIKCSSISIDVIALMLAGFANDKSFLLIDKNRSNAQNNQLISVAACALVIDIDRINDSPIEHNGSIFQPENISANSEGYVVTTSGSTGKPKVILGSHAGLAQFILWQKEKFYEFPRRVAQVTNYSFDVIYREILTTLISGSTLVIPKRDLKYSSGEEFLNWVKQKDIDIIHMVPSVANIWMKTISGFGVKHTFKYIFFAGEKLEKHTVRNVSTHFEVENFVNLYGPSETTLAKFYYVFKEKDLDKYDDIPVGTPLPHTNININDSGIVNISTQFPSLGYIDSSPFIFEKGVKWYPTGDVGCIRDSLLFLKGRSDDQVKINGVRVHLNEIKIRLLEVEGIIESEIVQNAHGKICAFYNGDATEEYVYGQLKPSLKKEVIPNFLSSLEALPRTQNGKIDRQALILQANSKHESKLKLSGDILHDTWIKISGYQGSIDDEDSIFELGGDSLSIVCFAAELTLLTGKKVEYWDIYENPKINQLRTFISNAVSNNNPQIKPKL